jgi:pimeloyl-ACP methyl ester carboxylesterase
VTIRLPSGGTAEVEVSVDRERALVLPSGTARVLDLPGRGRTVVHDVPGPSDAPPLVLLHGAAMTARLNWAGVIDTLRRRHRLVLWDQRRHGDGLRSGAFRLEDCADDVAAIAQALDLTRVVPVGYSMGGLVAQLVWRRHPDLVSGLVLCATSRNVTGAPWEQSASLLLPGLAAAAMWLPTAGILGADVIGSGLLDTDCDPADRRWALAEMRRTSLGDALAAMQAVCQFSSHTWIGSVDVPTAVVVTQHDRVVPPRRQLKLAGAIRNCTTVELDGGHDVFLRAPGRLAAALAAAGRAVQTRPNSGVA